MIGVAGAVAELAWKDRDGTEAEFISEGFGIDLTYASPYDFRSGRCRPYSLVNETAALRAPAHSFALELPPGLLDQPLVVCAKHSAADSITAPNAAISDKASEQSSLGDFQS
jgi:hypothetical protein